MPQRLEISWQSVEDCHEVSFEGMVAGENYVWFLVIVDIFIGFGEAEREGRGDASKALFGVAMQATSFYSFYWEGVFSLCNTAILKHYYKSVWIP